MNKVGDSILILIAFIGGCAFMHKSDNTFRCVNSVTYLVVERPTGVGVAALINPNGGYYYCQSDDLDLPMLPISVGGER